MAGTLWGTRTAGQELCRAGAGALWARGPRCSRLGDWWTLRSSHLPCLLSTSQPSPTLVQPGGVTGTLNLEPHQSAQRKNFALRPLDAVTKRPGTVTLERPGLDTLTCEGQGGEGGQGGRGARGGGGGWLRRGIWNDWYDVGWSLPPWDSRGFRPAQTRPCLQLPSCLNVMHSSPETVSKNLGSESALVLAQSGTFIVASQLLFSVWTSLPLDHGRNGHPTLSPTFFLANSPPLQV